MLIRTQSCHSAVMNRRCLAGPVTHQSLGLAGSQGMAVLMWTIISTEELAEISILNFHLYVRRLKTLKWYIHNYIITDIKK